MPSHQTQAAGMTDNRANLSVYKVGLMCLVAHATQCLSFKGLHAIAWPNSMATLSVDARTFGNKIRDMGLRTHVFANTVQLCRVLSQRPHGHNGCYEGRDSREVTQHVSLQLLMLPLLLQQYSCLLLCLLQQHVCLLLTLRSIRPNSLTLVCTCWVCRELHLPRMRNGLLYLK